VKGEDLEGVPTSNGKKLKHGVNCIACPEGLFPKCPAKIAGQDNWYKDHHKVSKEVKNKVTVMNYFVLAPQVYDR
jgi:hypothetical protein